MFHLRRSQPDQRLCKTSSEADVILYPYQSRVLKLVQKGQSVILQAPTGAGKTRAALAPFIAGFFDRPTDAPRKCLYITPMRVLANQFYAEYAQLAASYERRFGRRLNVRIQTGEQPDDRRFEGDLIFCTIDQFLSSYLMMPYSLPYRLANINAGALAGAYLVFDEFHLFDPEAALPTILHSLPQLSKLAPVVLMTATFSAAMLQQLSEFVYNAQIVTLSKDEITGIDTRGGQKARVRYWTVGDRSLTAEVVLAHHQRSSLVICNTVRRARELYRSLKQQAPPPTEVMLLHSQFLPDDRRQIEQQLQQKLGAQADRSKANLIVVATQAIEVGVDISAEVLHTDLAPPASLIQRAGRCARYPGEQGTVIVYPVKQYTPYAFKTDDLLRQEMDRALEWLKQRQNWPFDFQLEQEWVNEVSAARDEQVICGVKADRQNREQRIHQCQTGNRAGASRLLVRDVDSRTVLIHSEPEQLLVAPFDAIGLSLPVYSLRPMVGEWLQRSVTVPWRVKRLDESQEVDRSETNCPEYRWVEVSDVDDLSRSTVLVVHPMLAGYSPLEGFLPDQGNLSFISTIPARLPTTDRTTLSFQCETYVEHIQRVLQAFAEIALPELRFAATALEVAAEWKPPGIVLRAAWLACLLHDVGKLSEGWQRWAHAYQEAIGEPVDSKVALAHTTFDRRNRQHVQAEEKVSKQFSRPRHAAEGALACADMITNLLNRNQSLVKAVITAIARHHTPFVTNCESFKLGNTAANAVQETCKLEILPADIRDDIRAVRCNLLQPTHDDVAQFADLIVTPNDTYGWMAYTLVVRALRRADQRGTEMSNLTV